MLQLPPPYWLLTSKIHLFYLKESNNTKSHLYISRVITRSDLEQSERVIFRYRLCKYSTIVWRPSHPQREIVNLALWFVPEEAQSAWTLQETHRNSTSYTRDGSNLRTSA